MLGYRRHLLTLQQALEHFLDRNKELMLRAIRLARRVKEFYFVAFSLQAILQTPLDQQSNGVGGDLWALFFSIPAPYFFACLVPDHR